MVIATCTMMLTTSKEDLKLDIQIMGRKNNCCQPEEYTPGKFWSRHDTVDGTEATLVVGENAEPDHRPEAKILKSDSQITTIRASQGLPEGREIPHPRFNSEELEHEHYHHEAI